MVKEKWQKLVFREKLLLISGGAVILSIPLAVVTGVFVLLSATFFVVAVFYNLYEFVSSVNKTFKIGEQANTSELAGEFSFGSFLALATIVVGVPATVISLICLWMGVLG